MFRLWLTAAFIISSFGVLLADDNEVEVPFTGDPCVDYIELQETTREYTTITTADNFFCDRHIIVYGNYYRFTGSGNGILRDAFVPMDRCGAKVPMYMMSRHKQVPVESAQVCLVDKDDETKCDSTYTIEVRLCPANEHHLHPFYVYKLKVPRMCDAVYCSDSDASPDIPPGVNIPPEEKPTAPAEVESITVTCDNHMFKVELNNDLFEREFPNVDPAHLTLGIDECVKSPDTNDSLTRWEYPIDACNMYNEVQGDYVYYSNLLNSHMSDGNIIRDVDLSMNVTCKVSRDAVAVGKYKAEDQHIIGHTIVGEGNFTLDMDFYEDEHYTKPITGDEPVKLYVGNMTYVKISLNATDKTLKLILRDTVATPDADANNANKYVMIDNKCAVDPTIHFIYSSEPTEVKFGFKTFRFVQEKHEVFLHSYLYVCGINDNSFSCLRACVNTQRKKRSIGPDHKIHRVYNGPLRMAGYKPKGAEVEGYPQVSTNPGSWVWGLMAVGLLVSVSMIYLARSLKRRNSKDDREHGGYKYSRLHSME